MRRGPRASRRSAARKRCRSRCAARSRRPAERSGSACCAAIAVTMTVPAYRSTGRVVASASPRRPTVPVGGDDRDGSRRRRVGFRGDPQPVAPRLASLRVRGYSGQQQSDKEQLRSQGNEPRRDRPRTAVAGVGGDQRDRGRPGVAWIRAIALRQGRPAWLSQRRRPVDLCSAGTGITGSSGIRASVRPPR